MGKRFFSWILKTASVTQPITDSDSHFLAWTVRWQGPLYLKVDSLGNPHMCSVYTQMEEAKLFPSTEFTYDLAAQPDTDEFTFTFSRGLGSGQRTVACKT